MNQTQNLNLPQWEDTDAVKREVINDAMSLLDAAVSKKLRVQTWSYTGNGLNGMDYTTYLHFEKVPALLFILSSESLFVGAGGNIWGFVRDSNSVTYMRRLLPFWTDATVRFNSVSAAANQANSSGVTYTVIGLITDE